MTKQWVCILLLTGAGFTSAGQIPGELTKFLSKFEIAVMSHKYKKVLKLTDADYRAEQHDEFLNGNTRQFIDELLSGYSVQTNQYINYTLPEIDAISIKEVNQISETEYRVIWLVISGKKGNAECELILRRKKNTWGVVGAVG